MLARLMIQMSSSHRACLDLDVHSVCVDAGHLPSGWTVRSTRSLLFLLFVLHVRPNAEILLYLLQPFLLSRERCSCSLESTFFLSTLFLSFVCILLLESAGDYLTPLDRFLKALG